MTQKEQISIIVKKINLMDDTIKYIRTLLDRIEDRVISLEEQYGSSYREHREVEFAPDFDLDDPWEDKDEDDDE